MVCGQLYDIGTEVVLWTDVGGYDAYRTETRFTPWVNSSYAKSLIQNPGKLIDDCVVRSFFLWFLFIVCFTSSFIRSFVRLLFFSFFMWLIKNLVFFSRFNGSQSLW